jgi:MSHA type pilus biogenesis protein MshL
MKYVKYFFLTSSLLLLSVALTSCVGDSKKKDQSGSVTQGAQQSRESTAAQPMTLPVQYQTASYVVNQQEQEDLASSEENQIKVGARITSTQGPQPLWDIVKRLAALKGMNVSWASDVDRNVLVDVDINANDDFFEALDNMLRQVDYYHEMENNTLVIKYRETRQFQIAMPFTKHNYSTGTGGNVLGNSEESNNIDGTIELKSTDNEFDIWDNIKLNLDTILQIWTFRREGETVARGTDTVEGSATEGSRTYSGGASGAARTESDETTAGSTEATASADASKDVSGGQGYYLIDKPVGIITVTAPRPLLEKIEAYIDNLKKSLYRQISIEAKIIEVQLQDSSSIGINWSSVLKNFNISGDIGFGSNGQVYPFIYSNDRVNGTNTYSDDRSTYFKTINPGQFISNISLDMAGFDVFLNALNEQGNTKILSNPKLSVMNGQPALITVGRNVTYIDSIESDLDSETGVITYTVETERILSGIGMALTATVLGNDEVIMNLVPITSELQEPIEYRDVGNLGGTVGLPVVNVREMSTTVKIKDGEMLVIGGLISDTDQTTGEFAPLLGDIPILRYLFGYEEKEHLKRELIILLRPRII